MKTGDKKGADTDANIYIKLFSDTGKTSDPVKLNYHPKDYFKRGQVDTVLHKFITGIYLGTDHLISKGGLELEIFLYHKYFFFCFGTHSYFC